MTRAYPRECGGTYQVQGDIEGDSGLSPRVRGNHYPGAWGSALKGPIPASAGEPRRESVQSVMAKAYPRECGGTPNQ